MQFKIRRSEGGGPSSLWLGLVSSLLVWSTTPVAADDRRPRELGWISVEVDPMTTVLGARNLLVYVEPPSIPHWSASLIAFASDFPDAVDRLMSYRNRDRGFDLKVRASPGLTVDYFLEPDRTGWHVGLVMFLWRYEAERNGDRAHFVNHVIMPRVGYRWFPSDRIGFYLDPFAGLMTEYVLAGRNEVDGASVRPSPVLPFATVHAGFHF